MIFSYSSLSRVTQKGSNENPFDTGVGVVIKTSFQIRADSEGQPGDSSKQARRRARDRGVSSLHPASPRPCEWSLPQRLLLDVLPTSVGGSSEAFL